MKIIAYYRVSSRKQGRSGLGLEAQKEAVHQLAKQQGAKIIHEYVEVETGTGKRDRPILQKALSHVRQQKGTLVIAKLDRLARNVYFTAGLMRSGVNFIACDNPQATPLTIHILAAVAEQEAVAIAARTKAALQAAKARGKLLGSARPGHWEGREHLRGFREGNRVSVIAKKARAREGYSYLIGDIQEMHAAGKSFGEIACTLNERGYRTTNDCEFIRATVKRILVLFAEQVPA